MSNKLFAQIAALIVLAGVVAAVAILLLRWETGRERQEAFDRAQAQSNSARNASYDANSMGPADSEMWNRVRARQNSN